MWLGRASMLFAGVSARLKSRPSERKRPGSRGVDRIFSETLRRGGTGSGANQVHDKQKDRQSKQNVKGAADYVKGDKAQQPGDEHQNGKQQQHGSPRGRQPRPAELDSRLRCGVAQALPDVSRWPAALLAQLRKNSANETTFCSASIIGNKQEVVRYGHEQARRIVDGNRPALRTAGVGR